MTCGIYKISFNGTDKVYIGQSTDCNRRLSEHKKLCKSGKWPKKLQEAYLTYGDFMFEILLECAPEELSYLENLAIELYDSYSNGLNGVSTAESMPINHTFGEDHPNSKYSNKQLLEVLDLLTNPSLSFNEISSITLVHRSTINSIARGVGALWLKTKYPDKWNLAQDVRKDRNSIVLSKSNSASSKGIEYPKIKSPNGEIFKVTNIRAFAREHGLDSSSLAKLLKRKEHYHSHKGWTIVN